MGQTKKILITGGVLLTILGASAGIVWGLKDIGSQDSQLGSIDQQCQGSIDQTGFGHATLSFSQIKDQTGSISVDCILKIPNGTTVQLQNVQLVTKKLVVEAGESGETQSHLILNRVRWSSPSGGLQITMQPDYSTLAIKDSQFDYPLSIGASVGVLDDDRQTVIDVQNSQFTSSGPNSEGIQLVTLGTANFKNNDFYLNKPGEIALILGQACNLKNNLNANQRCHAP